MSVIKLLIETVDGEVLFTPEELSNLGKILVKEASNAFSDGGYSDIVRTLNISGLDLSKEPT